MEITSTNNSIYSTVSTSQTSNTNTQNTSSSFNTLVNTQNQDITTSSTNNKVYKKINDFLDAHNGYSSLSPTDEKIFRDILSDNKLTKEEADTLSYEQVEKITKLINYGNYSQEEISTMPMVLWGVDLLATQKTGNRQFNEAYYNTMKELPTNEQKHTLESEVDNNLGQLYLGRELKATFQYWGSYLANPWEYQNMNADFGKFIKDVKSHHEAVIADPKVDAVYKKQFQDIVDVYNILQKNYNEVISKTKNTNSENSTSSSTSSTKTTTPTTQKEEVITDKNSTQNLYDDIISLLRTGFTVGELKAFEERLKEILKMMQDKNSGKNITIEDINEAIKQLEREILEAKKSRTGQVLIKTSENTTSTENPNSDLETTIGNIANMFQEIKDSSKNTNAKNDEETKNEAYDRLKLLLKIN